MYFQAHTLVEYGGQVVSIYSCHNNVNLLTTNALMDYFSNLKSMEALDLSSNRAISNTRYVYLWIFLYESRTDK